MAQDYSNIFGQVKTLEDYKQAFDALRAQQTQQAFQTAALAKQAEGGLTQKDLIGFQIQAQQLAGNQQERAIDNKRADIQMENQRQNNEENRALRLQLDQDKRDAENLRLQEKKDKERRDAQIAVGGALSSLDQQIAQADNLFGTVDEKGNQLSPPMEGLSRLFGVYDNLVPNVSDAAKDANAKLETLRSGTLLSGVTSLKNSGVSLAPFSNFEGQTVQQATATLQPGQSEEGIVKNGREYANKLRQDKAKLQKNFILQYGGVDPDAAKAELARREAARGQK